MRLSFGATKNGALCAEAVVFFHPDDVRDFEYRRKKAGHLVSKMRFVSAQLLSYLENDRWLASAARANALAKRLAQGLAAVRARRHRASRRGKCHLRASAGQDRRAFARRRRALPRLGPPENGRTLVRLVTSFATPDADIERFLDIARQESVDIFSAKDAEDAQRTQMGTARVSAQIRDFASIRTKIVMLRAAARAQRPCVLCVSSASFALKISSTVLRFRR